MFASCQLERWFPHRIIQLLSFPGRTRKAEVHHSVAVLENDDRWRPGGVLAFTHLAFIARLRIEEHISGAGLSLRRTALIERILASNEGALLDRHHELGGIESSHRAVTDSWEALEVSQVYGIVPPNRVVRGQNDASDDTHTEQNVSRKHTIAPKCLWLAVCQQLVGHLPRAWP